MKLNNELLKKTKELENNVFYGNKLYSYDKENTIVIETELNTDFGDEKIGIDLNTLKLLRSLKSDAEIEYKKDSKTLIINLGKSKKYKAKTLNTNLPSLKSVIEKEITVDANSLKIAKKFTSTLISKPTLMGVALQKNGNIYATNGYKCYRHLIEKTEDTDSNDSIIIPSNFIDYIDLTKEKIEIGYSQNNITIVQENRKFISRLIGGVFPVKGIDQLCDIVKQYNLVKFNYDEMKENISVGLNVGYDEANSSKVIFKNDKMLVNGFNEFECDINVDYENEYIFAIDLLSAKDMFEYSKNEETNTCDIVYQDSLSVLLSYKGNDTFVYAPIRVN